MSPKGHSTFVERDGLDQGGVTTTRVRCPAPHQTGLGLGPGPGHELGLGLHSKSRREGSATLLVLRHTVCSTATVVKLIIVSWRQTLLKLVSTIARANFVLKT